MLGIALVDAASQPNADADKALAHGEKRMREIRCHRNRELAEMERERVREAV